MLVGFKWKSRCPFVHLKLYIDPMICMFKDINFMLSHSSQLCSTTVCAFPCKHQDNIEFSSSSHIPQGISPKRPLLGLLLASRYPTYCSSHRSSHKYSCRTTFTWDSYYWYDLTVIPAWISNHRPGKVWDEITYPFPNFNGCTVVVLEWISNFIPHFMMDVITYPFGD